MKLEIVLLIGTALLAFALLALALVAPPVLYGAAVEAWALLYSPPLILLYAMLHTVATVTLFLGITSKPKLRKPSLTFVAALFFFIGILVLISSQITTVTWIYPLMLSAIALIAHDLPDRH